MSCARVAFIVLVGLSWPLTVTQIEERIVGVESALQALIGRFDKQEARQKEEMRQAQLDAWKKMTKENESNGAWRLSV